MVEVYPPMESVYVSTILPTLPIARQGWEQRSTPIAESVDDYFYGDFRVLEMKHQVYRYAMTAMRRSVAKAPATCT